MTSDSPEHDDPGANRTRVFDIRSVQPLAAQEREHFLVMVEGPEPGRRISLTASPLKIGRAAGCDLVLGDSEISSRHCEVSARGGDADALVTDLHSTNGSFADGVRVNGSAYLRHGGLLQLGRLVFRHEAMLKADFDKARELERDLEKARHYVQSLLPAPIPFGPVRTDWFFLPSTQLGGDAFGYHQLAEGIFTAYLVDVSGHGVGAAMHGVTVMNILRQRALPDTDFQDPSQVLASLNEMFQMDQHDGMYFSMWYGVFDAGTRNLRYASAGHHPAYLATAYGEALVPLQTRNLVIGAMPEALYCASQTRIEPNSTLYIFSDGVFEVVTREGTQWDLPNFLGLLSTQPRQQGANSQRLYQAVREIARPGPLDDDFSLLTVTFA